MGRALETVVNEDRPSVEIPDPNSDLIEAFNERTKLLEGEVATLQETYKEQLADLKRAFTKASKNSEKIMVTVIVALVVGFATLLFSLAAVVITSWQTSSDAKQQGAQSHQLDHMSDQQNNILKHVDSLKK